MRYSDLMEWLQADGYAVEATEYLAKDGGQVFWLTIYNDHTGQDMGLVIHRRGSYYALVGGLFTQNYTEIANHVSKVTKR